MSDPEFFQTRMGARYEHTVPALGEQLALLTSALTRLLGKIDTLTACPKCGEPRTLICIDCDTEEDDGQARG